MDDLENGGNFVSTGSKTIDELLDGGWPTRATSGIFSGFDTGKSFLLFQTACHLWKEKGLKTLYIDTESHYLREKTRDRFYGFFKDRWNIDDRPKIDFEFPDDVQEVGELLGRKITFSSEPGQKQIQVYINETEDKYECPLAKKLETEDYGLVALDSFTEPIKEEIPVPPRQNFPTRSAVESAILGRLSPLAKRYDVPVVITIHETKDPAQGHYDSVPKYSPIVYREDNGTTKIESIEDLWNRTNSQIEFYENNRVRAREIKNIKGNNLSTIDTGRTNNKHEPYWTGIRSISRHKFNDDLIRINTMGGVVDVTPNHSVFKRIGNAKLDLVDARSIEKGDDIQMSWLEPSKRFGPFRGGEGLAWLFGFFAGDGSAFITNGQKTVKFCNTDKRLLDIIENILERNYNIGVTRCQNSVKTQRSEMYDFFGREFYTSSRKKKVPESILNARNNIKRAFLKGYYDADGQSTVEFKDSQYTSNSQTLLMGIIWLMRSLRNQSWSIQLRDDKPNITSIAPSKENYSVRNNKNINSREKVKKTKRIPYDGYVYDIETEEGKFVTGVGGITVKNTGSPVGGRALRFHTKYMIQMKGNPKKEKRTVSHYRYPGKKSIRTKKKGKEVKLAKNTGFIP